MQMVATTERQKTLTNMNGAAANTYVDVYGAAFEPDYHVIDFTNATQFRIVFVFDRVGGGTQRLRWVNQADNTEVLYESAAFTTDQDGVDTGWQSIPAAFSASTETIEFQARSSTAADDPVAYGFRIFLK
jgi:hypothetical protein